MTPEKIAIISFLCFCWFAYQKLMALIKNRTSKIEARSLLICHNIDVLTLSFRCLYWAQMLNAREVYTTELYQEYPSDQKFITVVYDKHKQGFDSWDELREWEDNRHKSRRRK